MNTPGLELRQVAIRLRGHPLVPPLDLHVPPGAIVTLMGESGVGKSSLLAFLCGTLPPGLEGAGEVRIAGETVSALPPQHRRLGILFQEDLLFPHLSVGGNLAFALAERIRSRADRMARIRDALNEAGLAGFESRDPASLSGGQRARVAMLRVLLSEPRALLLDEPFSQLDAATRQRFREFVFGQVRRARLPALLVSHDALDAAAAGGAVIQLAPPDPAVSPVPEG
ncbi:MAG: ATP-binding cassette domain-containing protein [Verrucomicrobiae bacterium]|nr:ATP-binding cassette domain-containing protein [Verrucomicrobiae bacterium]